MGEFRVSTMGGRPVDPCRTRPMPVGSMQDVAGDRINVWHNSLLDSVEFGLARVVEATSDAWNGQTSHAAPVRLPRNTRLEFDGDSRPDSAARRMPAGHLLGDDRRFDPEHEPQLPVLLPPGRCRVRQTSMVRKGLCLWRILDKCLANVTTPMRRRSLDLFLFHSRAHSCPWIGMRLRTGCLSLTIHWVAWPVEHHVDIHQRRASHLEGHKLQFALPGCLTELSRHLLQVRQL